VEVLSLAALNGPDRKSLWGTVRDQVARHERFKGASWALPEQELASLRSISEKYAPADPISAVVMLFDGWVDQNDYSSQGNQRRAAALQQLFADGGPEAVLRLAAEARVPYLIVDAADSAGFSELQVVELLSLSFDRDPNSSFTIGLSGLYRKVAGADLAQAWLQKVMEERGTSTEVVGRLFQPWPDRRETWNAVRHFGPEVTAAFWKQRSPHYLTGPRRSY
jgi:hypothetical protein